MNRSNGTGLHGDSLVDADPLSRFDTIQVHSGLETSPAHGKCTLPIYNSASFKFASTCDADAVFGEGGLRSRHVYSRLSNVSLMECRRATSLANEGGQPTNDGFKKRVAALEGGVEAISFPSGASAILTLIMSRAIATDNVIASWHLFGGTYYQFKELMHQLGITYRFCDTNDIARVEELIDDKTKFVFTETISNPKLSVADLEPLATPCHRFELPLVVDATFTTGGYFSQPGKWGADIVVHSATKWIGGHGTTLGGVIVDTGSSGWQANKQRFPQLHGERAGCDSRDPCLYEVEGNRAYMTYLRFEMLKDAGTCLSPFAAQQLFIGAQTISLRCESQAKNALQVARWLRTHPRVSWVNFLGLEDHPHHALARKYLQNGFCSVLDFGPKGGFSEGQMITDAFKLIINTTNVGDSRTIIGNQWSTTQKGCPQEITEMLGVYQDQYRLSVGIEDIEDIIGDFIQTFRRVPALTSAGKNTHQCKRKRSGEHEF